MIFPLLCLKNPTLSLYLTQENNSDFILSRMFFIRIQNSFVIIVNEQAIWIKLTKNILLHFNNKSWLKGPWHEIFYLWLFLSNNLP
jgi:hypothetical protein